MEMSVKVVTPDKVIFDGVASRVVARGLDGDFAILRGHAPMLAPLGIGELKIVDNEQQSKYIAVDGGLLEVSHNQVNILSKDAMLAEDIDIAMVQLQLERSQREKDKVATRAGQHREDEEVSKLMNKLCCGKHRER